MAARNQSHTQKPTGFLHKVAVCFVTVTLSGLAIAVFLMIQPQSLGDIDGLDGSDSDGRDVAAVLRESQQRQIPVTLTEEEINHWLAGTLEVKQGGMFGKSMEFKRVAVRLTDGQAEVVMERELASRPFTVSMFVSIEQVRDGDRLRTELNLHGSARRSLPAVLMGGRFGRMIVPQGFLRLVVPSYESLAEALLEELNNGFSNMVIIRIEDKKLVLDPRAPRRAQGTLPGEVE